MYSCLIFLNFLIYFKDCVMGFLNFFEYWNWIENYLNVIFFIELNVFFELLFIFECLVYMLKLIVWEFKFLSCL